MAGGLVLGVRLCFHNHAPQEAPIRLPLYKSAAHQVWSNNFCGAGEESQRKCLHASQPGLVSGLWLQISLKSKKIEISSKIFDMLNDGRQHHE